MFGFLVRECEHEMLVLFQVSPPYDKSGNTALTAANLLFEMLCVLPGVKYDERFQKS